MKKVSIFERTICGFTCPECGFCNNDIEEPMEGKVLKCRKCSKKVKVERK